MSEFQVVPTTIAGSGEPNSTDGVGLAADFHAPIAMAYSCASGILWISEDYSDRIRAMQPATVEWNANLKLAVMTTLFQINAIPIQPLVSIVLEFALGDSTSLFP